TTLFRSNTDIATRSEGVVGFFDFFEAGGIAESRLILISLIASRISTTPGMEGASNLGDVFIAQSAFCTVNHVSEIAGINEQNLVCTVNRAVFSCGLILRSEEHTSELQSRFDL